MKNTKKILTAFCAVLVLLSMAFSIASIATDEVTSETVIGIRAGEGTGYNEYLNMKLVTSLGFEGGVTKPAFSGYGNSGYATSREKAGRIENVNNVWQSVNSPYSSDGSVSQKFYMLDYNYNGFHAEYNRYADLYIQPKFGALDDVETTPLNGFISEFDIAFFSPVTVVMEDVYDEHGNPVMVEKTDEYGNIVYETEKNPDGSIKYELDAEGNPTKTPVYIYQMDENNNYVKIPEMTIKQEVAKEPLYLPLYDEYGRTQYDEEGNIIFAPELDADGNPVYDEFGQVKYQTQKDAEGNVIWVDKVVRGTFTGLGVVTDDRVTNKSKGSDYTLGVGMYNTQTANDGYISLLTFRTVADTREVIITVGEDKSFTFSADEWLHVTVQYNAETLNTSVYVGSDTWENGRILLYEKEAKATAKNKDNELVNVYPLQFRLGCAAEQGIVGFDNFVAYQGTTVHNPTLLSDMSDDDKMIYSGLDVLGNEEASAVDRMEAFTEIKRNMIDSYYSIDIYGNPKYNITEPNIQKAQKIRAAIDEYLLYDKNVDGCYDTLLQKVKYENACSFISSVKNVANVQRLLANTEDRELKISMVDKFLTSVGSDINRSYAGGDSVTDYIDEDGNIYIENIDSFVEANEYLNYLRGRLEADKNANNFIFYMDLFSEGERYGASLTRLQSHYEKAKLLYDSITDYEELSISDNNGESGGYTKLKNAVEVYLAAADVLAGNNKDINSERFIGIANAIKSETTGDWSKDNARVKELWKKALEIMMENNYNPDYEGFDAAKALFESANYYYWGQLQLEHLAKIREKLDKFDLADTPYIEKAGICMYVDKYVADNSAYIDFANYEITSEISRNEMYKAQLSVVEIDYSNILSQNTVKFVNLMKYIAEFDTYAELKPLYEVATEYYYTMNMNVSATGEDIDKYVEQYELLRARINATERDSVMFVSAASRIAAASDRSAKYTVLSECYSCLTNLDVTYEGAAEAKALYDAAYEAYVAEIGVINSELDQTVNVVCSVRGNWGFDELVSYVKNLLK